MSTPWEKAASSNGTTESERALTSVARRAFLSLWSYVNPFTDEGRSRGKGSGKELCDLMVVFGNDVVLFSDKDCAFQADKEVRIAWPRWYRSAIQKSANQLDGALKFLRRFPNRVYIDKDCQVPLPVALPQPQDATYHLVAVTRGSHFPARAYFGGGSSGSLMIRTDLRGEAPHLETPFSVGFPLDNNQVVHVLDELTLELVLDELDTVSDFLAYLRCKEQFLTQNALIVVPGEEELLARYMASTEDGVHNLPSFPSDAIVQMPEGDWDTYLNSPQRVAKKKADVISYAWDALIEQHASFVRAGTALSGIELEQSDGPQHEKVLRALASQTRIARRSLSVDLRAVLKVSTPGQAFARIKMVGKPPTTAFVFLSSPRTFDEPYETYRSRRTNTLLVYCNTVKEAMPSLKEAIGIASEPFTEDGSSREVLYVDIADLEDEGLKTWRLQADDLGILRRDTQIKLYKNGEREFPSPFRFVEPPPRYMAPGGVPMNRTERRKADREAKKATRRKR